MVTEAPPRSGWRRASWFVLLLLGGVLATGLVAATFKLLMLGAVKL